MRVAEDSLAIDEEASSILSKISQTSFQNQPKSAQDRPKIGPKSVPGPSWGLQKRLLGQVEAKLTPKSVPEPIFFIFLKFLGPS